MAGADEERDGALRANAAFYKALAGGDFSAMESLWARAEGVLCIHPGSEPVHGRDAVMASWQAILTAPPAIDFEQARVEIVRGLAFVSCIEIIDGQRLAATNVLVWEDSRWQLTHHQAGLVAEPISVLSPGSQTVH